MAALAHETGYEWALTDQQAEPTVAPMAAQVSSAGRVDALVNVAGGALGVESVAKGAPDTWMEM